VWIACGTGCGSSTENTNTNCAPNDQKICAGPNQCSGVQTCESTGKYSACVCADAGLGGAGGNGGNAGAGGARANGATCSNAAECASTYCVGAVCCDSACTDSCQSCKQSETGNDDGKCKPVMAGLAPAGQCAANRECDGNGGCRCKSANLKFNCGGCQTTSFVGGCCSSGAGCPPCPSESCGVLDGKSCSGDGEGASGYVSFGFEATTNCASGQTQCKQTACTCECQ